MIGCGLQTKKVKFVLLARPIWIGPLNLLCPRCTIILQIEWKICTVIREIRHVSRSIHPLRRPSHCPVNGRVSFKHPTNEYKLKNKKYTAYVMMIIKLSTVKLLLLILFCSREWLRSIRSKKNSFFFSMYSYYVGMFYAKLCAKVTMCLPRDKYVCRDTFWSSIFFHSVFIVVVFLLNSLVFCLWLRRTQKYQPIKPINLHKKKIIENWRKL